MPPRLYFLRHGEALHNVANEGQPEDHTILDPVLTTVGQLQALSVPSTYNTFFNSCLDPTTTLIVTSPLRRTLQTTLAAFASVLPPVSPNPVKVHIMPQAIEVGTEPCDRPGDLEETRQMYPQDGMDWSTCFSEESAGWTTKEGFFSPTEECQMARATWVRRWMRDCTYEKLVVVCHHGFLRRITKTPHHLVSLDEGRHSMVIRKVVGVLRIMLRITQAQWPNAELREYEFKDPTGQDPEAEVIRISSAVL